MMIEERYLTILPTVFDLYGNERLTEWRNFRNKIETSLTPLEDSIQFWRKAPFVSPYLDPFSPDTWPDPWHLVIDGKFDDLAICLGIMYTLKLTQRFMNENFEIHMAVDLKKDFYLVVGKDRVLNYNKAVIQNYDVINQIRTNKIWQNVSQP